MMTAAPVLSRASAYYYDLPAMGKAGTWADEAGGGLDLTGINGERWARTDAAFTVGTQDASIAVRWRPSYYGAPAATEYVLDMGVSASQGIYFWVNPDGRTFVQIGDLTVPINRVIPDGEWHTSVFVLSRSGDLVQYLDGVEETRTDMSHLAGTSLGLGHLALSGRNTDGLSLDGEVDGYGLWLGEALSPDDVARVAAELQRGTDARLAPNIRGNILDEAEGAWLGSRAHADKWPDIRGRHHAYPRANAQHVEDPAEHSHWLFDGVDPLRALDLLRAPTLNAVDYDAEGMTWVLVAEIDDPTTGGGNRQWIACRDSGGLGGYLLQARETANPGDIRSVIYYGSTNSEVVLGPAADYAGVAEVIAHSRAAPGGDNFHYVNGATVTGDNDPTGVMSTDQGYAFGLEPRDDSNVASGKLIGVAYFRRGLTEAEIRDAGVALQEQAESSAYDVGHLYQQGSSGAAHTIEQANYVGGQGRHYFITRIKPEGEGGWRPAQDQQLLSGGNNSRPYWIRLVNQGRIYFRIRNAADNDWVVNRLAWLPDEVLNSTGKVFSLLMDADVAGDSIRMAYSESDLTDPDDAGWVDFHTSAINSIEDTQTRLNEIVTGASNKSGALGFRGRTYRTILHYNGQTLTDVHWRNGVPTGWETPLAGGYWVPSPAAAPVAGRPANHLTFDGMVDSLAHAPMPLSGGLGRQWLILRLDRMDWWNSELQVLVGESDDLTTPGRQRAYAMTQDASDGEGASAHMNVRNTAFVLASSASPPVPGGLHFGRQSVLMDYDHLTGWQALRVSDDDLRDPDDVRWETVLEWPSGRDPIDGSPVADPAYFVFAQVIGAAFAYASFQLYYHQFGIGGEVITSRDWQTLTVEESNARGALDDQGNLFTFGPGVEVFLLPQPEVTFVIPPTRVYAELVRRTPTESGPHSFTLVDRLVGAYGLSWSEVLNGEGIGQATILPAEQSQDVKDLLRGMEEPAELVIYQDDRLQFQGPIVGLSAQRAGQGIAVQLHARSRFNYVRRWWLPSDEVFTYDQVDQMLIAKALMDSHQARPWGHFGLDTSAMVPTGVLRDRTYIGAEAHNVAERVQELAAVDDGFDFHVDSTGLVVVGYPELGEDRRDEVILDARNISNPNAVWSVGPEDVIGVAYASSAQDDGSFVEAEQEDLETMEKWGRTTLFQTFQGISVQSTLRKYAVRAVTKRARPLFQPQPDVLPLEEVDGTFGLGDTITVAYDYGLGLDVARRRVTRLGKKVDDVGRLMGEVSLE